MQKHNGKKRILKRRYNCLEMAIEGKKLIRKLFKRDTHTQTLET